MKIFVCTVAISLFLISPMIAHTWSAQSYNEGAKPQYNAALDALAQLQWNGDERVLDIGCGDGNVSAFIAKNYCKQGSILGIDICEDMINFAKNSYKTEDNISFMQCDASSLEFVDEFDVVVSFFCLHWIVDQQNALNGIARSLKKGGKALVIANCASSIETPFRRTMKEMRASNQWNHYFKHFEPSWHYRTAQEFLNMLRIAGFKIIFGDIVMKSYNFQTQNDFQQFLNATPGFQDNVPAFLVESFNSECIEKYLMYVPLNLDGSIPYVRPLFLAIMEKQ